MNELNAIEGSRMPSFHQISHRVASDDNNGVPISGADGQGANNNKILSAIVSAADVRKSNGDPVDDFGDSSLQRGFISGMIR